VRPSDLFDYLDWQGAARRPVTAKVVAIGEGDRHWQHFRRISPVGFLALWADVDPDARAYLEIENVDDYGYAGSLLAEIRVRPSSQYLVDAMDGADGGDIQTGAERGGSGGVRSTGQASDGDWAAGSRRLIHSLRSDLAKALSLVTLTSMTEATVLASPGPATRPGTDSTRLSNRLGGAIIGL